MSLTLKRSPMSNEDLILLQMQKVYSEHGLFQRLVEVLNGKANISLRLIDWFVTNFSKLYKTCYSWNGREFIVNLEYHDEMPSKSLFDPFCRGNRIQFTPSPDQPAITTTIGQLNFFQWAFKNGVIEYIQDHMTEITEDMNKRCNGSKTMRNSSSNQTMKQKRKRKEISISAVKTITKHTVEVEVKFN